MPNELVCDCCAAPVVLDREHLSVKCSACDQSHNFTKEGSHFMRIIPRLYPSWSVMKPKLRLEFIEYQRSALIWIANAHLALGMIDEPEAASRLAQIETATSDFRRRHADDLREAPEPKPSLLVRAGRYLRWCSK